MNIDTNQLYSDFLTTVINNGYDSFETAGDYLELMPA